MPEPEERVRERQDGDYEVPVLAEPEGGPVPTWQDPDLPAPGGQLK